MRVGNLMLKIQLYGPTTKSGLQIQVSLSAPLRFNPRKLQDRSMDRIDVKRFEAAVNKRNIVTAEASGTVRRPLSRAYVYL